MAWVIRLWQELDKARLGLLKLLSVEISAKQACQFYVSFFIYADRINTKYAVEIWYRIA